MKSSYRQAVPSFCSPAHISEVKWKVMCKFTPHNSCTVLARTWFAARETGALVLGTDISKVSVTLLA